ncbi:MAG: helix-turn-helix domain-containing protein [Lachnospirales bacterium]|nr:Uncharacterized response regulatory protein SA0215 [uncultured Clostridium sp.]
MKLLVADDERWIRKGIIKMVTVEKFGFEEILEAGTLKEYEEKFLEIRPEIVVSDVRFPNGSSCELCQKLHQKQPESKFVMLSGYDDFQYVKAALGYKAVDYLLKPVDKAVLNETIGRAVQEWQKEHEKTEKQRIKTEPLSLKNGEQVIHLVMKEIQKNCDYRFTLGDLAEKYHISEAYFSNLFTKTAGVGLMNYIMMIRVDKAKSLLLQTDYRINDIALAVGYEDTRYFAKVFRKITGESPTDYRLRERREMERE